MRDISIICLLVCSFACTATAQKGKDKVQAENSATLTGRNEPVKVSKPAGSATEDATGNHELAPDVVGAETEVDLPAPSTEGMTPGRAAKAKYMHENERLKARTHTAETKLAEAKAKIAKSRASLEAKRKKGKISAAEYESGMAKIKAAEEKLQYLETMVGESKQKTF